MNIPPSSPRETTTRRKVIGPLTIAVAALAMSACTTTPKAKTSKTSAQTETTQQTTPIIAVNLPSSPEQTMVNNIQATIENGGNAADDIVKLSRTFSKMYQEKYNSEPEKLSIKVVKPFVTNLGVAYMEIKFMRKGIVKSLYACAHIDTIPVNMTPGEKEPLVVEMTGIAFAERFIDKNRQRYAQISQNILRLKLHVLTRKLPLKEALREFEEYARGEEAGLTSLGFEVLMAANPTRNKDGQEIIQLVVHDKVSNTTTTIPFEHLPNRTPATLSNSDETEKVK